MQYAIAGNSPIIYNIIIVAKSKVTDPLLQLTKFLRIDTTRNVPHRRLKRPFKQGPLKRFEKAQPFVLLHYLSLHTHSRLPRSLSLLPHLPIQSLAPPHDARSSTLLIYHYILRTTPLRSSPSIPAPFPRASLHNPSHYVFSSTPTRRSPHVPTISIFKSIRPT